MNFQSLTFFAFLAVTLGVCLPLQRWGSARGALMALELACLVFYVAGGTTVGYWVRGEDSLWVRPGNGAYSCYLTWSDDEKTYSWWSSDPEFQMNKSGVTYTIVALIPLGE